MPVSAMAVAVRLCGDMMEVGSVGGGLQEIEAIPNKLVFSNVIALLSGPTCQLLSLFAVLPPMVFALVAPSWCSSRLLVHVLLLWPTPTRYSCDQ
jgi:hypothetical protein